MKMKLDKLQGTPKWLRFESDKIVEVSLPQTKCLNFYTFPPLSHDIKKDNSEQENG